MLGILNMQTLHLCSIFIVTAYQWQSSTPILIIPSGNLSEYSTYVNIVEYRKLQTSLSQDRWIFTLRMAFALIISFD